MAPFLRREGKTFKSGLLGILLASTLVAGTTVASSATAPRTSSTSAVSKGINICFYATDPLPPLSTVKANSEADAAFAKTLGANTVILNFFFYTASLNANSIVAGVDPADSTRRTASVEEISAVVTIFQNAGLNVVLRPLLEENNLAPGWRGQIAPTNRSLWFSSYWADLEPYLTLAQQLGISGFDLQSELLNMASDAHWTSLIARAKSIYGGNLIWNPLRNLGYPGILARAGTSQYLDLYPSLNVPDSGTVAQLVSRWNIYWNTYGSPTLPRNTTIGEIWILAQDGGLYDHPYSWSSTGAFDQAIQANWFTAACQFAQERHFAGINFWSIALPGAPPSFTEATPSSPGALQPLGLAAIQRCFAGLR